MPVECFLLIISGLQEMASTITSAMCLMDLIIGIGVCLVHTGMVAMGNKKNLRRISIVVTAQTKSNLERLAAACGYSEVGKVVDKLTREKMLFLHGTKKGVIENDSERSD